MRDTKIQHAMESAQFLLETAAPQEWAVYQASLKLVAAVEDLPKEVQESPQGAELKIWATNSVANAKRALLDAAPTAYLGWVRASQLENRKEKYLDSYSII